MIWMPNVLGLPLDKFDMVFIDEAQDLNIAQILLALNACEANGRIISVGDENQAIYGFRGADSNAIQNIVDRCHSKRMPLSVTYRCGRAIVELAKTLVPTLEAAATNHDGNVQNIDPNQIETMVKPGDFILSRSNAPLIRWCLNLLKAHIPANIQGRDLGKGFLSMIRKSGAQDVPEFVSWVQDWKENEVSRLVALKRDSSVIEDKAECLITLCEDAFNLKQVKNNIEKLFHDGDEKDRVILSTTHKAKGLERDNVFVLHNTYKPGKNREETNLTYVAYTRAKQNLYLVNN
jgi:superfamily I DNA/RNA helicase